MYLVFLFLVLRNGKSLFGFLSVKEYARDLFFCF